MKNEIGVDKVNVTEAQNPLRPDWRRVVKRMFEILMGICEETY